MTAAERIAQLRRDSPAASDLALACSLAMRVEPALLRALRLLFPGAGADAEADLYFSSLVTARDVTAIALDPPVARLLRRELAAPGYAGLLREVWQLVRTAHRDAHWSLRLEEQLNYLDAARPPDAQQTMEDLLLAGLSELAQRPDEKGVARWLLGALARFPADIAEAPVSRAARVAAGALLDGRADRVGELLTPAEGEAWLPWLLAGLPTTGLRVQRLDGAVVLGTTDEGGVLLEGIPQTDPLVIEARWQDGERARSVRVGVSPGEPVRVETGTDTVTLVFLSGLAYRLTPSGWDAQFDEPWYAAVKAGLRPCLARPEELAGLRRLLSDPRFDESWSAVWGPRGCGKSVVLVAAADELRARGVTVIEHFYGSGSLERDRPDQVTRSLVSQLRVKYGDFDDVASRAEQFLGRVQEFSEASESEARGEVSEGESGRQFLAYLLMEMAFAGAFEARPLVIVLDGLAEDEESPFGFGPLGPVPERLPIGVRCVAGVRTASRSRTLPNLEQETGEIHFRPLTRESDRDVCRAMLARDRADVDRAFVVPLPDDGLGLTELVDALPGRLDQLLGWLRRQPAGTVELDHIPPSLTTRWDAELAYLDGLLGRESGPWLLFLVAADGLNTWADCAQSPGPPEPPRSPRGRFWPWFKDACTEQHLVEPSAFDDLVRLTDASIGERLRELDVHGTGLLRFAHESLSDITPGNAAPLAMERASRTQRAAAINHALQADGSSTAVHFCLDLRYLRARYADDPAGLAADLAEVADRTGDPAVAHVRQAVHTLARAQVPPAAFVARLHDRLRAQAVRASWLDELFAEGLARPPLAVSHVLGDHQLGSGGPARTRFDGEPYLACALSGDGTLVLLGATTLQYPDQEVRQAVPGGPLRRAVVGPGDRIVAWSDDEAVAMDIIQLWRPRPAALGPLAVQVDFAAAIPSGAVLASADGTVQDLLSTGPRRSRLLVGHGARITAAVEHGGLLTASEDGTVRLWDADRDRARVFTDGRGAVRCLEPAASGPGFVTGGDDGWVRWWDPGRAGPSPVVARLAGHEGPVLALTVLWDGRVVSASADATLRVWDLSGTEPLVLSGHEDAVTGCRETSRGILSWSADGTVRHWPLRDGQASEVARGFPGGIRAVSVAGDQYAVLCGDGSVERRILLSEPGTPREGLGGLAIVGERAVAGVGSGLVTVGRDGSVVQVEALPFTSAAVSITADGQQTTVLDTDGWVWELGAPGSGSAAEGVRRDMGPPKRRTELPLVDKLAWLPAGVLAASAEHQVWLTEETVTRAELPSRVTSLANVGRMLAAGTAAGNVHLLYPGTGGTVNVLTGGPGPVNAVTTVGGDRVAIGTPDGTVRLMPLTPTGPAELLLGHSGAVTALASVDRWLVSGGADGRLLLWYPGVPEPVHTVVLDGAVTALAAGDGWLAARDATGSLWLLELQEPGSLVPSEVATLFPARETPDEQALFEQLAPNGVVAAHFQLLAHADLELCAVTARAGDTDLPIDLWFGSRRAETPQPARRDLAGGLWLPLWWRANESIRLWAVSATKPTGPVAVKCLVNSPHITSRRATLIYRRNPPN